jgi:hypothetical protein
MHRIGYKKISLRAALSSTGTPIIVPSHTKTAAKKGKDSVVEQRVVHHRKAGRPTGSKSHCSVCGHVGHNAQKHGKIESVVIGPGRPFGSKSHCSVCGRAGHNAQKHSH